MRRSLKFLLRPTAKQAVALAACLDDHRQLYNAALEHRRTAYRKAGVTVRYGDQSGELKHIRADDPDGQARWSFSSQQATLRLQGVGHVRVHQHQHRRVRGKVKTTRVKREGSRWYVVLSCDDVPAEPLPATGVVVGVDMGVASLVTTSDGVQVANPRHLAVTTADRLAAAQREPARRTRGSRRRRAVAGVAALHGKVGHQRLDSAHKAALALVRGYDVIVHEELRIAAMTRSASGTIAQPGRNVAQKSGSNRSILDAG
ncbi:RNA-guided endonuclease InsQ/TnpB family protein [Nonomuraea diastatica]|uniref:RNA-guided endonuclease InsQ/TnpB family protein n=1 Tax=Nonomuraea diastatica TaxID=1848329 RepID=UPI001FE2CDCA|nr:RNA-guided endonuclease TnpB family protein [Nonomuraea diastatica]